MFCYIQASLKFGDRVWGILLLFNRHSRYTYNIIEMIYYISTVIIRL